jgi:hypothetical protein
MIKPENITKQQQINHEKYMRYKKNQQKFFKKYYPEHKEEYRERYLKNKEHIDEYYKNYKIEKRKEFNDYHNWYYHNVVKKNKKGVKNGK